MQRDTHHEGHEEHEEHEEHEGIFVTGGFFVVFVCFVVKSLLRNWHSIGTLRIATKIAQKMMIAA
ncbi:MAG: hypothetical protein U9Q75_07380 [Pseudomonadota bacterium]|nr:hypothetical protein [Pseudomonadota bacterium]